MHTDIGDFGPLPQTYTGGNRGGRKEYDVLALDNRESEYVRPEKRTARLRFYRSFT